MTAWVPLHVHSALSPQWGVHSPEALCRAAKRKGCEAMALTDRNGLYGWPRFHAAAVAQGLKPIVGCELTTATHRAVVLGRNAAGYRTLCRLISNRQGDVDFNLPTAIAEDNDGLIVLSDQEEVLQQLKTLPYLYVECSPGHRPRQAVQLARRLGLPPVATSRAVFLHPHDMEIHRVLRAIALKTSLKALPTTACAHSKNRLYTAREIRPFFPETPEAIEHSGQIASLCAPPEPSQTVFPAFRNLAPVTASRLLARRAKQGAIKRYGSLTAAVRTRLAYELRIVYRKGFSGYFLMVQTLVRRAPHTCGRGSAAASLVAYCLGITHVDPLRYDLFFDRFLNPDRKDLPDIDVDFPWDEREDILQLAIDRFGHTHVAHVANHIGFRRRAAIRETAKVFGLANHHISNILHRLSTDFSGRSLRHRAKAQHLPAVWQSVFGVAEKLNAPLRHLSLHCGGIVITPTPVQDYAPTQPSARGRLQLQWDKDQTEASGLVKIDLLGNRSLAVLRDAVLAVQENTGDHVNEQTWSPQDDTATTRLIWQGQTLGCFYIESPATRQLLQRMWGQQPSPRAALCDLFEHLVMACSIIRPAANPFLRQFIARMRGESWHESNPGVASVLAPTYGIAIYQEQITQLAMTLAGFSAGQGDRLRKALSKGNQAERVEAFRLPFLRGCQQRGMDRTTTERLWQQVLSFAGYSFCKPHSASYAMVSLKAAWLKAHYPAEFIAAVINNKGGFYRQNAYISEAERLGLTVKGPDINQSDIGWIGKEKTLRCGFEAIDGLAGETLRGMIAERNAHGHFSGFEDFRQRTGLGQEHCRQLIRAGCFDAIEDRESRGRLFAALLQPATGPGLFTSAAAVPPTPITAAAESAQQTEQVLGFIPGQHPLEPHSHRLPSQRIKAANLLYHQGQTVSMAGVQISGKTVYTKEKRPMGFISFEDETGLFETVFFPASYRRHAARLRDNGVYLLQGRVEAEWGVLTLNVNAVRCLTTGAGGH